MTKEEIEKWLNRKNILSYTINKDLSVDVNGDVNIAFKALRELPVQFNIVKGSFVCKGNKLISLKGCPKIINGDFDCSSNLLKDLIGGPTEVGGQYLAAYNKLTSLEGIAKKIGKNGHFGFNQLTTLSDIVSCINGHFYCHHNDIKELGNFELIIGGSFVHQTNDDGIREIKEYYLPSEDVYRESDNDKEIIMSGKDIKALTLHKKMEKEIEEKKGMCVKNKI